MSRPLLLETFSSSLLYRYIYLNKIFPQADADVERREMYTVQNKPLEHIFTFLDGGGSVVPLPLEPRAGGVSTRKPDDIVG